MSERVFRLAAAALVLLAAVPQFLSRTIPDTAWLLHVAGRVLDGARLYVDLVDVNPPLVVWLNFPVVLAARAAGVSDLLAYRLSVLALVLASAAACGWILRRLVLPDEPGLRRTLLLLLLFAMLPLAREDFGEREHLMLALAMPYVLLAAARLGRVEPPGSVAAAAGLAAGVGIALKPYFVFLWVAREACLLLRLGRAYRLRREAVLVVLVGAAYLAAVARWSPEYFDVVRLMAGPYYTFLRNSLPVTALLGDGAVVPLAALLGYAALRRWARRPDLGMVLAAATAALYLSAVVQHKGWRYHFYPSIATGVLLLGLLALDLRRPVQGLAARVYAHLAAGVTITLAAWTALACIVQALDPHHSRYDADPDIARLVPVVRERAGGGGVMVLSWSMASTFPLVTYSGVRSVSRFNHLWIPGAVYHDAIYAEGPLRYREPAERGTLERYLTDAVVEDLEAGRPRLLLVLRPAPDRREWGLRRLDFLKYFGQDPRFARLFARYRHTGTIGEYWLFERLPDGAPDERPRTRE
ncbi:MAG TPA: hypothetical protein VMN37_12635 [Gemmatimonadales bacterium]|nr:hypothetical protein [Gemmatimonadales bacterium]